MYRFLIISGLFIYVLYKFGNFFFKAGAASQHLRDHEKRQRAEELARKSKNKKGSKLSGGEYVDYEEVK